MTYQGREVQLTSGVQCPLGATVADSIVFVILCRSSWVSVGRRTFCVRGAVYKPSSCECEEVVVKLRVELQAPAWPSAVLFPGPQSS